LFHPLLCFRLWQWNDPGLEEKRDCAVFLKQICRFVSFKKEVNYRKTLEISGAEQYRKSEKP